MCRIKGGPGPWPSFANLDHHIITEGSRVIYEGRECVVEGLRVWLTTGKVYLDLRGPWASWVNVEASEVKEGDEVLQQL